MGVDLPFAGQDVVANKKGLRVFFVFEGSLSKKLRLSVTVLSCFWAVKELNKYSRVFWKYWDSNPYFYICESLGITPAIARKSYVTDAVRISDGKREANKRGTDKKETNRTLLWEEVKILKPSIVVLVGSTAKKVFKEKGYEAGKENNGSEIIHVPFPTKRASKKNKRVANKQFEKLSMKLNSLLEKNQGT